MATDTAVDVVMPQMGVSVSEGTITKWLKAEGEAVQADEPLLEISTDKVDTEVPSPASGVVSQIVAQEGETVEVGTTIAVISPQGRAATPPPPPEPATQDAAVETTAASSAEGGPPPLVTTAAGEQPAPPEPAAVDVDGEGRAFVSPVVGRIAAEHGVDVSKIPGTGRGGRVTKKDILEYIGREEPAAEAPAPTRPTPPPPPPAMPPPPPPPATAPASIRGGSQGQP